MFRSVSLLMPVLVVGIFIIPDIALAQNIAAYAGCTGTDCSTCNVVRLINGGLQWFIGFLFVLFAVLIAWAGFNLVVSGGNHHAVDEAKAKFTNAIIGLIIILSAWLIVDTIMRGLVGRPNAEGQIPNGGSVDGWLFWSEVQCYDQSEFDDDIELEGPEEVGIAVEESVYSEDISSGVYGNLSNTPGWTYVPTGGVGGGGGDTGSGTTYTAQCPRQPGPAAEVSQYNCSVQQTQCNSAGGRATIIQSGRAVSCFVPAGGGGTVPAGIVTNSSMRPIFDPAQGGSSLVKPGAAARMQQVLAGPFARLQQNFGRQVVINDAIAKAGTSRETETPGSRHFYGDALDLSTAGMSNADKMRLFEAAKRAGFTGFGFGNNILHVDLGPKRGWSYGNATYGGRPVSELIGSV